MKFLLVKMSANWFLVSMYLIWILESRLIRSNCQSRAILWVLETCLSVGLLPFMIILIIVLLSSNTLNKVFLLRNWRLRQHDQCLSSHRFSSEAYDVCEHQSQIAPINLKHEKHFQEQKQSDPTIQEQADNGLLRSIMVLNRVSKDQIQSDPINRERESRPISIQRPKT